MNRDTVSVECEADMCSACVYEDCACDCHLEAFLNEPTNEDDENDED